MTFRGGSQRKAARPGTGAKGQGGGITSGQPKAERLRREAAGFALFMGKAGLQQIGAQIALPARGNFIAAAVTLVGKAAKDHRLMVVFAMHKRQGRAVFRIGSQLAPQRKSKAFELRFVAAATVAGDHFGAQTALRPPAGKRQAWAKAQLSDTAAIVGNPPRISAAERSAKARIIALIIQPLAVPIRAESVLVTSKRGIEAASIAKLRPQISTSWWSGPPLALLCPRSPRVTLPQRLWRRVAAVGALIGASRLRRTTCGRSARAWTA